MRMTKLSRCRPPLLTALILMASSAAGAATAPPGTADPAPPAAAAPTAADAAAAGPADAWAPPPLPAYRQAIESWRAERQAELTSENGWLTVVGLFWLQEGENRFGS